MKQAGKQERAQVERRTAKRLTLGLSLTVASATLLWSGVAGAHMPYVAPSVFDLGKRDTVAIEASFTEDAFRPEIAMDNAPFEATGPDGATRKLDAPTRFKDRTLIEAALPADGVYRLSSGQRLGRMNVMVRDGKEWKLIGEGTMPPAGAETRRIRSTTLADAYVLRGRPSGTGALAPRNVALEIHPLADPTTAGAKETLPLEILYFGKPLAGAHVTLFREAGFYDGRKSVGETASDADGRLSVTPPDAGRYLLLVRHRGPAPMGVDATYYSYTATLAFEAM